MKKQLITFSICALAPLLLSAQIDIHQMANIYGQIDSAGIELRIREQILGMRDYQRDRLLPWFEYIQTHYHPIYMLHTSISWDYSFHNIIITPENSGIPYDIYYFKGRDLKATADTYNGELGWIYKPFGSFAKGHVNLVKKALRRILKKQPDYIFIWNGYYPDVYLYCKDSSVYVYNVLKREDLPLVDYLRLHGDEIEAAIQRNLTLGPL